jgi:hypothetical protein
MYQNKLKKYTNKLSFRGGSSQENTWNCTCGTVNQNGIVFCRECNLPQPLRLGGQEPSTPVSLFGSQEGESPLSGIGSSGLTSLSRTVIPEKEKAYLVGNETAQAVGYSAPVKPFKSYSPNEVDLTSQDSWEAKNAKYIKEVEEAAKKTLAERKQLEKPQKKYPNSPHQSALLGNSTAIPELDLEEEKKEEETKEIPKKESCIIV